MNRPDRSRWVRGRRGEWLAAWWLRLWGWGIVARNLRTPMGEIDLVARRGGVLAVIEVKARPNLDRAAAAISPRQQERLVRAAGWLIAGRPDLAGLALRFDAVLIRPWRWPRHLPDAWRGS